tara:strand:- start:815 stop:1666 length:852 start_codon:yes stop_codon:yes gene_type:complete
MSPENFEFIARLLREQSGLVLTRDKGYLVENRLAPVVREFGFKSVTDLAEAVKNGAAALRTAVVDAMISKDTGFFRDWTPFVHFQSVVLPNIIRARSAKKNIRILCAGCSSGQEAYSIAMSLRDAAASLSGWKAEIVGIDISSAAVADAVSGNYSQFDVQKGLPVRKLLTYFTKDSEHWKINPGVQGMVQFKTWNLLEDLYPLGRFDVVLCRNVLVYFDLKTKLDVLQKISRVLADDGVLYLGLDDAASGVSGNFHSIVPDQGIYAVQRSGHPSSSSLAAKAP